MTQNIHTYKRQLSDMGVTYPEEFLRYKDTLYSAVKKLEDKFQDAMVACHVDNYFGNIMIMQDRAILIDWEYAGMCDEYCELANFSLINDMSEASEIRFLKQYFADDPSKMDVAKYYLFKMANSFMWSYWHLIKLNQQMQVDYNGRRWRERLYIAVDYYEKFGGSLEE